VGPSEGADEVSFKRLDGTFGFAGAFVVGCDELRFDMLGVKAGL
jgi:hypothetical protein